MKKTFKLMAAAMTCGLALTSCVNNDNPTGDDQTPKPQIVTITFENQALNADNFWIGDTQNFSYSYEDGYGGTIKSYASSYEESGLKFNTSYSLYLSEWGTSDFWSGFAISARTEKGFTNLTPDQYNNVTGTAHGGKNFCIVQTYGETIDINAPDGILIRGFYYTNSSYTVNSILNGDYYSGGPFEASDWLTLTVKGTHTDGSEASVDISLAKNGSYVNTWQYADLTPLGKVTSLSFAFTGSRTGEYGLNTPAYICVDDIIAEVE